MHIPARFAPIDFGAMLSAIMVAIVSAFVIATARGVGPGFTAQWLKELRRDMASCLSDSDDRRTLGAPPRRSRDWFPSEPTDRSRRDRALTPGNIANPDRSGKVAGIRSLTPARRPQRGGWCERRDSNPHGGHPLEPKSSASTSSATFARESLPHQLAV